MTCTLLQVFYECMYVCVYVSMYGVSMRRYDHDRYYSKSKEKEKKRGRFLLRCAFFTSATSVLQTSLVVDCCKVPSWISLQLQ